MTLKSTAQRASAIAAPLIQRIGGSRLLAAGATFFSFLDGQGAGAGWDMHNEIATAARFIRATRPVILDVGANRGEWSHTLSAMLGDPAARFYLFEVAPYCFPEIALRQDGIANHRLVQSAVSDSSGSATLHIPTSFSGLASLHARRDVGVRQRDYDELTVDTVTLDDFAAGQGLDHIAFVKLDIEGHELAALKGAHGLLAARRIDSLSFEFGSANVNSRSFFRDFWDLLTGHGYRLYRMIPGGGVAPVARYTEQLEYFRGATNYVATCLPE